MPKKCIKFVSEYLIPNLDNKTFGDQLKWIDKSKNIFEIDWQHKAGPEWTERQAQVFVEWDKHKGHYNPGNKAYYTQSKQRFRALLYKLTKEGQLINLPSKIKFKKVYCIGQKKNRRRKTKYESNNEEETSEEQEYENPDAMTYMKNFKNEAVILEDHSYHQKTTSTSANFSGFILYNIENNQLFCSFQDTLVPISSNESSLDNFQKRVLVERNSENRTVLTPPVLPSFCEESFSSYGDLRDDHENSTVTLSAGKFPMDLLVDQNTAILENMFPNIVNSSPLPTMESYEQMFYQNCDEENN